MAAPASAVTYGQYKTPDIEEQANLRVGQPGISLLPLDLVRRAAHAKLEETDPELLQYGNIYGFPKAREAVAKFVSRRYGFEVRPENVMLTNGNTGALALVLSLYTRSGDLVFAEEPTYFIAKSIMSNDFKLRLEQVKQDESG